MSDFWDERRSRERGRRPNVLGFFKDMFREFFGNLVPEGGMGLGRFGLGDIMSPIRLDETAKEIIVKIDVPGIKRDQIQIHGTEKTITIIAEGRKYRRELPVAVIPQKAAAHLEDGVLEVKLAKKNPEYDIGLG